MRIFLAVAGLALCAGGALAQGCIVGRQCTPGSLSSGSFLMPKELEYGFTYRTFRATDHYVGTVYQTGRRDLKNYVINRQNIFDLIVTRGVNSRSNFSIDVPILDSGWSVPRPLGSAVEAPGPRSQQNARGLGDVSLLWKTWLKNPEAHGSTGNVVLGVGVKLPTGKANVTNVLPDNSGGNFQPRVVDQSIQPGDGSWGVPTSLEAYKKLGKATLFFTTNYLISPRDTNGVPSGFAPTTPSPSINVFSVPDQYLYRLGVSGDVAQVPGLSASLSWRKEGVPAKDLIGGSHGFRRPGYSTSVEPSLSYSKNGTSYNLAVPVTLTRNRVPLVSDGTAVSGDASFARSQFILNISRRVSFH